MYTCLHVYGHMCLRVWVHVHMHVEFQAEAGNLPQAFCFVLNPQATALPTVSMLVLDF